MILGIDISAYQSKIDWPMVGSAGCEFVIVKMTDGNHGVNRLAEDQIKGALDQGMLVMLYHYAQPNGPNWIEDAIAERELCDSRNPRGLFTFLDVERDKPLSLVEVTQWQAWSHAFRRAGKPIGFYSGDYFTRALRLPQSWEETVLWMARYPGQFLPDCSYATWPDGPQPWARVDVWQFGGGGPGGNNAVWPGVTGPCDVNAFAGSRAELEELLANAS